MNALDTLAMRVAELVKEREQLIDVIRKQQQQIHELSPTEGAEDAEE